MGSIPRDSDLLGVVAWLSGFLNVYKEASQVAQVVKNPPTNAGESGDRFDSLGWEDSPGVGNDTPTQYSCLGNPMDRGAWGATVYGVAKRGA